MKQRGREGNRRNVPGPLEKINTERIIRENYFLLSQDLDNHTLNEHNFLQIRKTQFVLTRCYYDQGTKLIGNSNVIV